MDLDSPVPLKPSEQVLEFARAWNRFNKGEIPQAEVDELVKNLEGLFVALSAKERLPSPDLMWKQYELHVDLYKHLLDLTLRFNAFYWVGTGAVLSFYFSKTDMPMVRYALLFPILVSVLLVPFFGYGVFLLNISRKYIFDLSAKLGFFIAPEINVLGALLASTAFMLIVVASVLLWFFFTNLIWVAVLFLLLVSILLWLLFRE